MKHPISYEEKKVGYMLRRSTRAKRMRLSVYADGRVMLTLPFGIPESFAFEFLQAKAAWVIKHLSRFVNVPVKKYRKDPKEYLVHKSRARILAEERLRHFNGFYGFSYKKISIRDQKTRWGSCSKKGNLNFNYRIALLPPHLADYIIVHELCHLGAFDHSKKFWDMVAVTIPEHHAMRRELKAFATHSFLTS